MIQQHVLKIIIQRRRRSLRRSQLFSNVADAGNFRHDFIISERSP